MLISRFLFVKIFHIMAQFFHAKHILLRIFVTLQYERKNAILLTVCKQKVIFMESPLPLHYCLSFINQFVIAMNKMLYAISGDKRKTD